MEADLQLWDRQQCYASWFKGEPFNSQVAIVKTRFAIAVAVASTFHETRTRQRSIQPIT